MPTIDIPFSPVKIEDRKKLDIRAGDTVRVWQKVKEGDKTRLQAFEGIIIARKHGREPGATFTVRKISGGIGVERIFPLYSPNIEKIELLSRSKVRRAKLYYIREKAAREMRKKMKKMQIVKKVALETPTAEHIGEEEIKNEDEKDQKEKELKNE